jgi:hypothetical protein
MNTFMLSGVFCLSVDTTDDPEGDINTIVVSTIFESTLCTFVTNYATISAL